MTMGHNFGTLECNDRGIKATSLELIYNLNHTKRTSNKKTRLSFEI